VLSPPSLRRTLSSPDQPPPPVLFPAVDRAAFTVAFTARLRRQGMSVGLTGTETFAHALAVSPPRTLPQLYWAARISLVRRRSEIEIFDEVFDAVFKDSMVPLDPHARRRPRGVVPGRADDVHASLPGTSDERRDGSSLPWATLPPTVDTAEDPDAGPAVPERLPSRYAGAADRPFEQLDDAEEKLLGRWLEGTVPDRPTRRSRRQKADSSGHRVALRATIKRSRQTGWEPVHLVRERAVDKPRHVIMLCDVSQSMQAQMPAYFHLMRALAKLPETDVFAFATTLTRLTPALAHTSADRAMSRATAEVTDRFGGTRIATNIRALLSSVHGGLTRGAVVLIASDGWDGDSPEELAAAMLRLRRHAHRVIWMNPRAGAPGFEPKVATMAAALPYCDMLLPADTFRSLRRVITALLH